MMLSFIQACVRDIGLTCATWDITLAVGHVPGTSLSDTADAFSRWHLGQSYRDKVAALLLEKHLSCIDVPDVLFSLSKDL